MKAIVIEQYGSSEQLVEKEMETETPGDRQVLVDVYATSINPIDWKLREGYMKDDIPFEFPIILGWDVAGVVRKAGKDVTAFGPGDRVFARPKLTGRGTYAEQTLVDEDLLVTIPEPMSYEEAAGIPLAGMTAQQCLLEFGEITEGSNVLIQGGSGGVGHFAIQVAKDMGAYVAATASGKNQEFLKQMGADVAINYEEENVVDILSDYDMVLDTVGESVHEESFRVLRAGGRFASVAAPPSQEKAEEAGITAGFVWLQEEGEKLRRLTSLYNKGALRVEINSKHKFSEKGLRAAHRESEEGRARGKIVIMVR